MTQTEIIQILAGFVGSIGFAILFNIRGKSLIATAIGGLFSWLLFVILSKYIKNEPFVYFIIACVISTYAERMARVLKTPTSAFITTSLIPGGSLYYTMVHAFEGDLHAFLPKAIYTMQLASALALGIIVSTSVARIFNKEFFHKNRNKI